MPKLSDNALVKRTINGDTDSYAQLVERYEAPLRRYLRSYVYDIQACEDVTQETFIKAYTNLRSFKQNKKFSSWIYRIAHNEAINYIRKHRHETLVDDDRFFSNIIDEKQNLAELFDAKIDNKMLSLALLKLKLKYKQPLVLFYLEAKSYEEISEILRIPTSTVGTRIRRAKRQLKQEIVQRSNNE